MGFSVASVNARGLTADADKRVQLSAWMNAHSTDIMNLQEYYVHHEHSKVEFDMSNFKNYDIVYNKYNTKTVILLKKEFQHEKIDDLYCKIDGLDLSWLAIFSHKHIIIIGSIYHSPHRDYDNIDLTIINEHMEIIYNRYKNNKKKIIFYINGDWNAKHLMWGSTETDHRGLNLANWMARSNMDFVNDGSYTHIGNNGKEDAIDLSIISNEGKRFISRWKIHKDLSVINNWSDHYIMETLIDLNPIVYDIPDRVTWNFDEDLIDDFKKNIKSKMIIWRLYYNDLYMDKTKLNQLAELFQLLFVQSCTEVFGFKYYNSNNFNWVSKKVMNLIEQRKKIKNQLSHLIAQLKRKSKAMITTITQLFNSNIPRRLKKYWKSLKNRIHKLDKKIHKNKQDSILTSTAKIEKLINKDGAKNDKVFWSISNKLTYSKSNTIPPQRDKKTNKIVATTIDEIANHIHKHFIRKVDRNEKDYQPRHLRFHEKIEKWWKNYKINRKNTNSILNREYPQQEVLHVINDLNENSAMSFDFIHFKMIKWCKMEILENLTLLFNLCFNIHQESPNIWKFGEYIPVPKPGRPPQFAKNIRPIMVIPGLARIISKLNCNRILSDCVNRKLLDPRNCAFQKNKSTHDITIATTENLYQCIQNGHFGEIGFEDLDSAYDSVWFKALAYRLVNEYDMDGNMIAYLISQSTNRQTRVVYNGTTTEWRYGQDNLPQGMPDSIALFILLYNKPNINKTKNQNWEKYQIESIHYNEIDDKNEYHEKIFNFDIDFSNFADDSAMETMALPIKINLNDKIKRDYRLAMQLSIEDLFEFTKFWKLAVKKVKCNTITFSNKLNFNAYVYKLGNESLELIHSNQHAPINCKHNAREQYSDGALRLDENYSDTLFEGNGCLDLSNLNEFGEIIDKSLDGYSTIAMGNKNDKNHIFSEHELPKSIRILGMYFDPKLYFNEHINIVVNKAKYKLYKLQQMAMCKYYNFSSHTIYKLYESVIQPKLEYGLFTVANKAKVAILETFRRKAAKIALGIKKQSPTIYLDELLHAKSIQYRLDVARIKLWNNYSRAPTTLLKHHTFKKWKSYILSNGGNINECKKLKNRQIGRDELFKLDENKFNFVSKSPLSQAYFLMDQITPIECKIFRKRKHDVLKPIPCYNHSYPTNVNIFGMNKHFENPDKCNNTKIGKIDNPVLWKFYSDGSCVPNPGPGGSAYYSPDFVSESRIEAINHDTTINFCELNSIHMIYNDVLKEMRKFNQRYDRKKYINIYTDSKFVINQLNIGSYPQYQYYYKLIDRMNQLANQLNDFNIFINIIKIPSHKGFRGNEIADTLAKQAAVIAYNCKYRFDNTIKYNTFYNPINVDISKDLINLNKWYKYQRKNLWLERQHK